MIIKKSTRSNKKYMALTPNGWVHFGSAKPLMGQYRDNTGLNLYGYLNHFDESRRKRYLSRSKGIRNKRGELTYKDKNSANYLSIKYLW